MTGAEGEPSKAELDALRAQLGLTRLSPSALETVVSLAGVTPLTLDADGLAISVFIPSEARHAVRQRFKELARREKRRASDAGNTANTILIIGGSIGGPLATTGIFAVTTSAGHLAVTAILVTAFGGLIALGGLMMGHWQNKKKFAHEERLERYLEVVEEMT